jgi:hypothetical protein
MTVIEGDHGSTYFYPDSDRARRVVRCQMTLQARAQGNALLGRALYPLLTEAGFGEVHVSPRMVYVDASKPELVEGFTKNTFTAMIEGMRPSALESGLMSEADFDRGVADLYRTAEADGVFCYTFFKASAVNGSPAEPGAPGDAPRAARPSVPVPTPGGRRAESQEQGQGVVARRGLRRANDAIRAVPAASSFAVADDLAGILGGPQRPGQQQENEEGERTRGGVAYKCRFFRGG